MIKTLATALSLFALTVALSYTAHAVVGPTPSFAAPRNFVVEPAVYRITVADFDKDGKPDIATSGERSGLFVHFGDGAGNFVSTTTIEPVTVGCADRTAIASGDFNGDSNPDLAIYGGCYIRTYLGDGNRGFVLEYAGPGIGTIHGLLVGDFNNDNRTDLIALLHNVASESLLLIYLGDGIGGFAPSIEFYPFGGPQEALGLTGGGTVGDFNSDGNSDVAISAFIGPYFELILLGDGTGHFPSVSAFPSGRDAVSGDFNQDGHLDFAGAWWVDPAFAIFGDGTGSFSGGELSNSGATPLWILCGGEPMCQSTYELYIHTQQRVGTADFNSDGFLDLAISSSSSNKVTVVSGSGTGTFGPPTDFGVGTNPTGISVADFDLDDRPDIAVPNYSDGTISVLLNTTSPLIGPPTNKNQCKNGGWRIFNSPRTFRNQGDCVSFVNTGH